MNLIYKYFLIIQSIRFLSPIIFGFPMLKVLERRGGMLRKGSLEEINSKDISWLNCYSPTDEELSKISKKIRIPTDRLMHFLDEDARPHLLNTKGFSAITLGVLRIEGGRLKKDLVSIFLLPNNNILTLSRNETELLRKFEQLALKNREFTKTPASFVYYLVDEIISGLFCVMDALEESIDYIENEVIKKIGKGFIGKVLAMKRDIILLHKTVVANREVITVVEKGYSLKIKGDEAANFRFLYNDLVQLIDMSDTQRDIVTGIIEIYLSTISNMLNNTIKRMTAWGSLVLIPTLIASIYGMNFQRVSEFNMPELYWVYGYPFSLGLMLFSVIFLYAYFKMKRWF